MLRSKVKLFSPFLQRRPLLPRDSLKNQHHSFSDPQFFLQQDKFLVALKYSNPEFFERLQKSILKGNDLSEFLISLQKFYLRAMSHSTPRKLWAGFEFLQGALKEDRVSYCESSRRANGLYYVNPNFDFTEQGLSGWAELKDGEYSQFLHRIRLKGVTQLKKFVRKNSSAPKPLANFWVPRALGNRLEFLKWCRAEGILLPMFEGETGLRHIAWEDLQARGAQPMPDPILEFARSEKAMAIAEGLLLDHRIELQRSVSLLFDLQTFEQHHLQLRFLIAKFQERFDGRVVAFEDFVGWLCGVRREPMFEIFRDSVYESFAAPYGLLKNSSEPIQLKGLEDDLLLKLSQGRKLRSVGSDRAMNCVVLRPWGGHKVYLKYVCGSLASTSYSRQAKASPELLSWAEKQNIEQRQFSKKSFYVIDYQSHNPTTATLMDSPAPGAPLRLCVNTPKSEKDLSLKDLCVVTQGDRFVVINSLTKKPVCIAQSNLLDFYSSRNPYNFALAWLAYQDDFLIGSFDRIFFPTKTENPRVELGNVVLVPRRWTMKSSAFANLDQEMLAYLNQHQLPNEAFLRVGDSSLLINFLSKSQRDFAKKILTANPGAFFEECPPAAESSTAYFSDFFYSFSYERTQAGATPSLSADHLKDAHSESGRLLSVYLYMDPIKFNPFLQSAYQKVQVELKSKGIDSSSYFVRYFEGGWHLRIRFLVNSRNQAMVFQTVYNWVAKLYSRGVIDRHQFGPYEPETMRYGGRKATIAFEKHSCAQSRLVVQFLRAQEGNELPEKGKEALVLRVWDIYLRMFCLSNTELENLVQRFAYGGQKSDVILGAKDRKKIHEAIRVLKRLSKLEKALEEFATAVEIYIDTLMCLSRKGALLNSPESILRSVLHMFCNRIDGLIYTRESEFFKVYYSILKAKSLEEFFGRK